VRLSGLLVPRAIDRVAVGRGREVADGVAVALGIALLVLLAGVKLAEHLGFDLRPAVLFAASALWMALAAAALGGPLRRENS
jgi:hypothetical protein